MDACVSLPLPMHDPPVIEVAPAQTDSDVALVERAIAGELGAFERLYRRHATRVHGAIWRFCGGNQALAEDLTQDAFVRAWTKLASFRFESAFSTWLHRLAVNVALMHVRGRGPDESFDHEQLDLLAEPTRSACLGERADLERAVATLPPRARAVLILFDIEGWTHHEIATELGMAVGSSKAHLHRARGLLRRQLDDSHDN